MFLINSLANMLAAFGRKSVEVYEWDRPDIVNNKLADHAAWTDVTSPRADLEFTGWSLAHAVVRADFLISGHYGLAGIGFLFQIDRIVDFTAGRNLRLQPGAANALNDVSKTSMIGRVGQGLSILFADQRHYNFLCHLAFDPSVAASLKANKNQEVADFLFENDAGDRMILESKATFTLQEGLYVIVHG